MTDWSDPRLPSYRSSPRQMKRLSRDFAGVGVGIPPERLQQIVKGGTPTDDERIDVTFALTATALLSEKRRRSKRGRAQQRCVKGIVFAAAILVAINVLLCLGLMLFVLTQHTSPY
ncbi:hypothetical protein ORI20_04420 [Mycobacterium sp. CVI_P3]|uniref:Uncharacterized protein n=1 Tax=Mycobacterium pinniadriaticum TaxID=2994102 RepID=A0ABT3S8U6_9MYCO|nr:hypothetical protein [Mycobacterium pinniadriaticum]MCX2929505.1 hypothetical protein [Mycobacterium pinniadriaticum]MCX2935929.1 hypothetical protein [Mycobacterium pinniadriaticum]